MNNNILTAIQSIVKNSSIKVLGNSKGIIQNRANQIGSALEDYVKDAFANCLGLDERSIKQARKQTFSYLGNNKNPPDAMLINSDAIEIKKIKSLNTPHLQLNSSYPKNKLYSNNNKISNKCRDCEEWKVKDMLYVIGQVEDVNLKNIFFIYGDLYCDSHDVYERIENSVKYSCKSIEEGDFAETNELGRINRVDHLGISDLRIRGMWLIKTPFHQFDYLINKNRNYTFKLTALIPEEKFYNLENHKEFEEFCKERGVSITTEEIDDPQNPANSINAKLIIYYY